MQAAGLLAWHGSDTQRQRWLPPVGAAEALLVPAFDGRGEADSLVAERYNGGWRLRGAKRMVPSGHRASAWLVRAGVAGDAAEARFFIVPRDGAGVSMRAFDTVDSVGACALRFDGAMLADEALLVGVTDAEVQRVTDHALLVVCAESVGAMKALLKATVEYTRTRQQFGKPLAANQVLRHRIADLSVLCDEAEAMTLGAVALLAAAERDGDANARSLAAAAARAKVAAAARFSAARRRSSARSSRAKSSAEASGRFTVEPVAPRRRESAATSGSPSMLTAATWGAAVGYTLPVVPGVQASACARRP